MHTNPMTMTAIHKPKTAFMSATLALRFGTQQELVTKARPPCPGAATGAGLVSR